ncbi:MAG: MBL fold metallo-hydrolase [Candidatus Aenigmarchaeota archaeon]|nr:MBL fold metallo-hydrolase [Candidatus Aenigmarchaeota archaeon]
MSILPGIELFPEIGNNCNVYLVDKELLIDTGSGENFTDIRALIQNIAIPRRIKNIVLTHCHHDHSGGSKKFRDWLKAVIAIHSSDRRALETGKGTEAEMYGEVSKIVTVDKPLRAGTAIITANFEFEVLHTPGHTPGSICLYDRSKKILFSGDTVFENSVGRTDLTGGSVEELIASLKMLSGLQVNYLFPGHGPVKTSGVNFHIKQMIAQAERSMFL